MQHISLLYLRASFFRNNYRHAIYFKDPTSQALRRSFTSSPFLNKNKKRDTTKQPASETKSPPNVASEDPLDITPLEQGIANAVSRLKDELSKLRIGGRLNPDIIEGLRVQLSKGSKETAKLGELAQVLPKGGRMVTILVSEETVCLETKLHKQFFLCPSMSLLLKIALHLIPCSILTLFFCLHSM